MPQSLIGIFGGTFNPVHVGHVRAAIEVAEALGLGGVEFVPAARPPHKCGEPMLDFPFREKLCRLAVRDVPGFSVNAMEAGRPGPSYTWDTLETLGRERPETAFCFILGQADLPQLPTWKNGLALGRLAHLAVHSREGQGLEAFAAFMSAHAREMEAVPTADPARWNLPQGRVMTFVPIPRLDVSASDVRERWRRGRRIHGLVAEAVRHELENHAEALEAVWGRRDPA